jgi:hypothetical protein
MSKYEVGVASTQVLALTSVGGDIVLDVGGGGADLVVAAVRDAWAWCIDTEDPNAATDSKASRIYVVLDEDPTVIADAQRRGAIAATGLATLMHLLTQAITVAGIDRQAGLLLMLHAGAFASSHTGKAVVAVAAAGTGKTTFVRTLGRDRIYLTDETVGLRDDFFIVPYPKPLSVHTTGENVKVQTNPGHFGLIRPTGEYKLAALWSLQRTASPTPARLETISTLEAITTIAPEVSYLSSLPEPLHRLAAAIHAAGGMTRVVYHEVEELRPLVDSALGSDR